MHKYRHTDKYLQLLMNMFCFKLNRKHDTDGQTYTIISAISPFAVANNLCTETVIYYFVIRICDKLAFLNPLIIVFTFQARLPAIWRIHTSLMDKTTWSPKSSWTLHLFVKHRNHKSWEKNLAFCPLKQKILCFVLMEKIP